MHPSTLPPERRRFEGSLRAVGADVLFLPAGLLAATFLTRSLGPSGYGLFTLAATLLAWIDWVITSAFSAAVVKFIGEAEDWHPVARAAVRLHLVIGAAAGLLLWVLAEAIAGLLNEPILKTYVRLFAIGLPAYTLACAHRYVLVGLGNFKQRALASAGRALAAPLLIIVLVESGLSVSGAILGNIGACLIEVAIARWYVRPALLRGSIFPLRRLCGYAVPLFFFGLSLRLFSNLDLFALKTLGGTGAQAGIYGAAQNLAIVPGYVAFSFAPLLLSALSRVLRSDGTAVAKEMAGNTLRAVVALLPFIAIVAGAAPEIVAFFFGAQFSPAAPILAVLVLGVWGRATIAISTTILTAAGKPGWAAALAVPLVPLAMVGHWWLIPVLGPVGAALVTATLSLLACVGGLGAVYNLWAVLPPKATLLRSLALSIPAYSVAAMWPAAGLSLLVKIPTIALAVLLGSVCLGEFSSEEIALARSLLVSRMLPRRAPDRA